MNKLTIKEYPLDEILSTKIPKINPLTITSHNELKQKYVGKNGRPKPESKRLINFFDNLKIFLNDKYSTDIDPIVYLYYLYNDLKISPKDIYARFGHFGPYSNKSGESIKRMIIEILFWETNGNYDKKTVGEREIHLSGDIINETSQKTYNVLRNEFTKLYKLGIHKPSGAILGNTPSLDDCILRYKHLLLNYIFLKRNKISHTTINTKMESGVSNGRKKLAEEFDIQGVNKNIISYPLNQIYIYITNNIISLKGDNKKQIILARQFNIKNLGILYSIVKGLGMLDELGWKLVNLPIEKYEKLIEEIEIFESNKHKGNHGLHFIQLGMKVGIKNSKHLHTGLSSLGITQKYGLTKIDLANSYEIEKAINYILKKYPGKVITKQLSMEEVNEIVNYGKNILPEEYEEQIKIVVSILNFLGYKVTDLEDNQS